MSAPSTELPKPGDLLADKYVVESVLGTGGMGVVVAARHQTLGQKVALKFLLPKALESSDARDRFLREARAAAGIRSEHVARVLDVGTLETGAPFIVMEHLEGCDLRSLLEQQGALPVETAVDYVLQASEAIAEAHSLGIVHRDLKPANLFLARRAEGSPFVKVLDFGISKTMPEHATSGDASLTRTDAVLGSPAYMAPEQIRSAKSVDIRTDVWALGVILYELLTDAPPFDGDNIATLSAQICIDPPAPLAEHRGDVPEELVRAIDKCLEKEPARRHRDLGELSRALLPFAPGQSRVLVERIGRLTGSIAFDETQPLGGGARSALSSTPGAATAETANATATTVAGSESAGRPKSNALALGALAALGALVVAALSALVLQGSKPESAPESAAREAPRSADSVAAAPPPPAVEPAAPPPSQSAAPAASAPRKPPTHARKPVVASPKPKACKTGQVLSNGQCCPLGLVWQGTRCDRPLATKF